jgi:hypothetical protein
MFRRPDRKGPGALLCASRQQSILLCYFNVLHSLQSERNSDLEYEAPVHMYEIGTGPESAQGCAFFPFDSMSGNELLFPKW